MRKLYNTVLFIAALFAFAPILGAQNRDADPEVVFPADNTIKFASSEWNKAYEVDEESNVAYRKIISKPNSQGIYHILLDAFATGNEVKVNKAVRADIVLVLDVSNSMSETLSGNTTKLAALKSAVNTFVNLINTNDKNNGPTANTRLGNRIAIVPFGTQVRTTGNNNNIVRSFRGLDDDGDQIIRWVNNLTTDGGTNAHLGMQQAYTLLQGSDAQVKIAVLFTDGDPGVFGMWSGSRNTQSGTINSWARIRDIGYGQYANYANTTNERVYENTLYSANHTIEYASKIKALATEKTDPNYNDPSKRVIASVFTVSVIENPSDFTKVYLGKTSSNFKKDAESMGTYTIATNGNHAISGWNSTDIWANGPGTRNKKLDANGEETTEDEDKYAITASNASQLEAAFATIASSTNENTGSLGESSVSTVDVVSASFLMPKNADDSSIRVYTAACTGVDGNQRLFGDLILAPNRTDTYQPMKKNANGEWIADGERKDVDNLIPDNTHLTYSSAAQEATGVKDKITVEGFDFTNNWCGEVLENGVHKEWHGYKISILIPIRMNPDALGGVDVNTNTEDSGIYIGDSNKFPFTSPKVNLPVNIIINKQGLDVGESSKFTIWRSTNKTTWEEVTSVFVTRHSGQSPTEPRTRIEGLPATDKTGAEYVYKVKEDDWSWSYTLTSDAELLSDDNDNPFTFTNEKKNNIDVNIRHAESKVTNTFTTGGKAEYDDSKNNNRTVITFPKSN